MGDDVGLGCEERRELSGEKINSSFLTYAKFEMFIR